MPASMPEYFARRAGENQARSVGAAQIVLGSIQQAPDELAGDINLGIEYANVTGKPKRSLADDWQLGSPDPKE